MSSRHPKSFSSMQLFLTVAIFFLSTTLVDAQCDPGGGMGGTGADVIVGELTGTQSYGNAGGYYAYSVGTTSCNIGTENLLWISNTNEHPVIGQNMFRLKDGVLEQIGMSWLKHGFTALQNNACGCGCSSSGSGSALGVGCSDPYSSGLNGSQGSLGSRSEVTDPAHGEFIYPQIMDPGNSDLTWRRLRVHGDDMNPSLNTAASYFVEGHYITPDDAAAGNHHNNVSYRAVSVSTNTSNHAISFTGTTQRQQPGIQAWQDNDPNVTLVDISDGDDGLLILGYKVTQQSANLWQYEYALYNMDSTRAVRSFSLPLLGVVASNIGFHDVEYHSTEIYDGTDWTTSTSGGEISWSTSTFAQNPNANALRWGTMYNFRFVSTSAPTNANATLGMFQPGAGDLLVPTLAPMVGNLDCNNNGIPDADEIASGASDCDGNGLLDECQEDCDNDGEADACELLAGALDCDGDFIPDTCQIAAGAADCDFDNVLDSCELSQGTETDCDLNGVIDSCQIAANPATDCDNNNVLDACEAAGIFSYVDNVTPPEPIADNLPDVIRTITVDQIGLVDDVDVTVNLTHTWIGDLAISLSNPSGTSVTLHAQSGGNADDINAVYDDDGGPNSTAPATPLSALDGQNAFGDWTLTISDNAGGDQGVLNDWGLDVAIAGAGIPDCNNNGVHDGCEINAALDCNSNGVLDECDISSGNSADNNGDGVPDECVGGGVTFVTGDTNSDGGHDISDAVNILSYLFGGGQVTCIAALNNNGDNSVDISDVVYLLVYLFDAGANPAAPFPSCGTENTSGLSCDSFSSCP
ncbi:MAG: proprotein convertase P-domain-containing protein [Planctomycetota bacterium]